ncbi:MAG TPA: sugar ABC transporter permease [Acholeplasmataceae bacterium]|jgi:multiple sugar transport system permease protein|nr:sugar ABC transporter permease [Acholeplasmataceae bacterium]
MIEYKKDGWRAALALAPMTLFMLVFTFWPIINAFIWAFLDDFSYGGRQISHGELGGYHWITGGTFIKVGIANFKAVLTDDLFWKALRNTAIIVAVSVPLTVIIGLAIAVALNSIKRLRGFFQTIFFLPYVTNTIALGMVFATLFHQNYGLVNKLFGTIGFAWINGTTSTGTTNVTFWSALVVLVAYTVWDGLAFKIIVFLSGLQSIDKQYYQAAQIDATPKWRVFTKITVPLLSPMILYITITSFIGAFKAYSSVIAIFGTGTYGPAGESNLMITVVGYIYDKMEVGGTPYGTAAAASLILFFIILLITILQLQISKKRVHY